MLLARVLLFVIRGSSRVACYDTWSSKIDYVICRFRSKCELHTYWSECLGGAVQLWGALAVCGGAKKASGPNVVACTAPELLLHMAASDASTLNTFDNHSRFPIVRMMSALATHRKTKFASGTKHQARSNRTFCLQSSVLVGTFRLVGTPELT